MTVLPERRAMLSLGIIHEKKCPQQRAFWAVLALM